MVDQLTEPLLYLFIKNLRITLILSAISNTLVVKKRGDFGTLPIPKIPVLGLVNTGISVLEKQAVSRDPGIANASRQGSGGIAEF